MGEKLSRGSMKLSVIGVTILLVASVLLASAVLAQPAPPTSFAEGPIQRRTNFPTNQSALAYAGNVTQLTITQQQLTEGWQAYYGSVSGTIVLDDALNNSVYTWSLAGTGEVYATTNATTPTWASVTCFNFSRVPTEEAYHNIPSNAADNITETFNQFNNHPAFSVGGVSFSANQCNLSVQTYVNDTAPDGATYPRVFNETLLYANATTNNFSIYMSILNDNQYGFNASLWDFQMLVPEDGWNSTTASTTYYFYTELE